MAQAANDPQIEDTNGNNKHHIWPMSLILNPTYAAAFSCVKCKGVPKSCMNDEDGYILCSECAQNVDNATQAKAVQKLVNNLKTKCLSISQSANYNANFNPTDETEGTNVMDTKVSDQCDWTGKIQEYQQHEAECPFVVIVCDKCKAAKCQRQLMPQHLEQCPEVSVDCSLSCGSSILRKDVEDHLQNVCVKQLLACTNDDCKVQIERQNFKKHVEEECDSRIVRCEFKKYGCKITNIRADNLQQHMDDYKFDHLSNKFDFVTTQQQDKITALEEQLKNVSKQVQLLNDESKENTQTHQELTDAVQMICAQVPNQFDEKYSAEAYNFNGKTATMTTSGVWYALRLVKPISKYNCTVKFKMGYGYYGIGYGEDKLKCKGFPGNTKSAWMVQNTDGITYSNGSRIGMEHWQPTPGDHRDKEVKITFDLDTRKLTINTNGNIHANKGDEFNVDTKNKLYFLWAIYRKGTCVTLLD